ncbi:energy-coupling factor transporter transmembrane component T family protein [Sporosarcina koreensis]|uniref:Energy-coupling factor transporter transmembrane component T family protein n=1 Tax=Sporosarcina koreensis TaxID=334735 RepID=A0ABW0U123_9BACL
MNSALHKMNPSAKFIVVTVCMLTMAFFFNPWTPLLMWIGVIVAQLLFSRIDWKVWILFMIPFFIMAFGYFWTTLVFAEDKSGPVVLSIGSINITEVQMNHALSLSFRVLAFSGLSLLFALTTNPVSFILSLMQQMKLSPKISYSILVGYQFLPVLKDEFVQIQQAHRLRGAVREKNAIRRLLHMRKILLPMLAGAVRKAERAAFAMEARGFTGDKRKDFYKVVRIGKVDGYMVSLFMLLLVLSCTSVLYMN